MNLVESLLRKGDRIISLVGGGGKTTTMYRLAKELVDLGHTVVVTTTTNIMLPTPDEAGTTVISEKLPVAIESIRRHLRAHRLIGLGSRLLPDGKLKGVPENWVAEVASIEGVDFVVVEADGSAGKPFKAPAEYEPVVPSCTDVVVSVVGVDVIGQPLERDHVHRPERVCAITAATLGDPVTPEMVAQVVLHPLGLAKGAPAASRIVPLVNKVDDEPKLTVAREIAALIIDGGMPQVVIARSKHDPPVVEVVAMPDVCVEPSVVVEPDVGAPCSVRGSGPHWPMISIIILAAGKATRLGGSKLLLEIDGVSLIRRVVANALKSSVGEVIVVLGHEADSVERKLRGQNVKLVMNPRFAEGQSTSLVAGLRAVSHGSAGAIVMMGDQPFVGPEILDALIRRHRDSECLVVVPEYGGQRGSPALFDRALFPELLASTGDKGGRDLIQKHADRVEVLVVSSLLAGKDVDTREAYLAVQEEVSSIS